MDERSMLDIAYEIIGNEKEGIRFYDLFDKVTFAKEKTDDEKAALIGRFYSDLLLDGRFIVLDDNVWDLKERYKFETTQTKVDLYENLDQGDQSEEDKAEEKEYEAAMRGQSIDSLSNEKDDAEKDDGDNSSED